MKLNTKLLTITALFIAALMLLSPISQINTSGGGGTDNYDLDFLNSLDLNNNNFVLSADQNSYSKTVSISSITSSSQDKLFINDDEIPNTTAITVSSTNELDILSGIVNSTYDPNKSQPIESNFSGYTVILTDNLKFDIPAKGQSNFIPIGNGSNNFNGTFDGQGYTISNLKVFNMQYAGLFGYLESNATVKNLKMINSEISATSTNGIAISGGIAGNNSGTIINCYNTGAVTAEATSSTNYAYSGGIAGNNNGTIANCYNTGAVTAEATSSTNYAYSGGIAGVKSGGTITNCYNTGTVTSTATDGYTFSGGIAGYNSGKTIINCYNTGNVIAKSTNGDAYSGGIAGWNHQGTITDCYNTGAVNAEATSTNENKSAYSGGIAGNNSNNRTITNCYNTGTVTATATDGYAYSGGITGRNYQGSVTNCYNIGYVTSETTSKSSYAYLGGIAGHNFGTIENCYNTGTVTATANYIARSGGIVGYNSETITNCYNAGTVTATSESNYAYSGGIIGENWNGTITNCYNTGVVTADSTNNSAYSGGIAGRNHQGGAITNCYNSGTVTGTENYFGEIAGENYVGTITSCYHKNGGNLTGNVSGTISNCKSFNEDGEFSDNSGSLLDALNGWVTKANERNPDDYRYWMDPFIKNEKYPVFTDWYGEAKRLNESLPTPNAERVYVIENEYQLALIADMPNGSYVLSDNIDLSGYEWRPIGDKTNQFNGTFDGQGNTISNLSVNINSKSGNVYSGLFGYLGSDATVKNLGIIDSVIFTNTTYIDKDRAFSGGIVGYNDGGTVTKCYYTGTVIGTGAVTFGGIVGENKNGTVSNCHNTGTVIGTGTSGGIVGYNDGTITNCYNTGVVIADTASGDAYSGGIVGNNGGPITNCYNTGVVIATSIHNYAYSGGIAGNNSNNRTITNCYNTGTVTATATDGYAYSGGIAGFNSGTIENCYNTGVVTATANKNAYSGGIAGYNNEGKITNCYNTGFMTADSTNDDARSGGIAGHNYEGKITNCYNTGFMTAASESGDARSGGIAGNNYGTITNCYNTGTVTATATDGYAYSGGIAGFNSGTIENCYNTGVVIADTASGDAYSGGIAGNNIGEGIKNTFYQSADDKQLGIGNTSEDEDSKTKKLNSDNMKELKLLSGDGSNYDLNDGQDSKPWSPDIFGVNNGYPILAEVPTQVDPNSANKPPQSAVYVTLDSETAQAENYLEPFMLKNGKEIAATINYLINPDKDITSYQWYTMNDKGVFIEVSETSHLGTIQETYYVKVTINGYSYTSLTRTVSDSFIVMFDNDGGSGVDCIMVSKGKAISQPGDPIKTGYTFEGWYTNTECNVEYNFGTSVTENTILYAKWEAIKYTVKYHANGSTSGTVPIDNEKYTIGKTINIELNEGNLAKSGHIFRGWNYTPNASSALSSPIILDENVIKDHIGEGTTLTLYAVWTPIPEPIYTLCLNSNDSTLQTKRYSGTYGTEVTLKSASDFGWNDECKFIEWNSKSDGSGISYKEGDKFSLGSDVWNLYAIWSDSSYHTVSFDSNGGNSIPSQSIQDGYRASEPTGPVKQGHSFKYWSLNGTKYDFNQSVKEDITLKAEYEVISYKVTFYYNGDVYYSTQVDYNTSLGDRMPSLPSDKDSWNTSENGKGSNFTSDSLITSDTSVYAVSENSITSILIIGGSAAAILAAIAAWMFMRSRYN